MMQRFLLSLLAPVFLFSGSVLADKNHSTKPMNFSSNSADMDDLHKTYHYVGHVRMTQGTRLLTSDKVSIQQDAAGFSKSIAYGSAQKLAYVKQRENDGKGWMEGWGERIEYNERTDTFVFFDQAHIKTSTDDAKGDPIPEMGKALPAQPAAPQHPPKPSGWTPAPSKAKLPSENAPTISTTSDGRAKAVLSPGK